MTKSDLEVPQPDLRDKLYKLLMILLSPVPIVSGVTPWIVESPIERRTQEWQQTIADALVKLNQQVEAINIEDLSTNEKFITAVLQIKPIAIATHVKEKHQFLRNALLNSALPTAPDDDRQQIFLKLLDEFTVTHIKILHVFNGLGVPAINLNNLKGKALDEIGDLIESVYPELKGHYHLYLRIINDLTSNGLIANNLPERNRLSRNSRIPELTKLGESFLAFLESPLDDEPANGKN